MVKNDEIRIAIIAIVIEDKSKSNIVNSILHDYSDLFVGRMGIRLKKRKYRLLLLLHREQTIQFPHLPENSDE